MDVYVYHTLEECLRVGFGHETIEELKESKWKWYDNGVEHIWPMRRGIRIRKKIGVWGFCWDKEEIHMWVGDHAKPRAILKVLSHELGHMQRPFKRLRNEEEKKADEYGNVACKAFDLMEEIFVGGYNKPEKDICINKNEPQGIVF